MIPAATASAGTRESSSAARHFRNTLPMVRMVERAPRFEKPSRGAMRRRKKSASRAPIGSSRRQASEVRPAFTAFINRSEVSWSHGALLPARFVANSFRLRATAARVRCDAPWRFGAAASWRSTDVPSALCRENAGDVSLAARRPWPSSRPRVPPRVCRARRITHRCRRHFAALRSRAVHSLTARR